MGGGGERNLEEEARVSSTKVQQAENKLQQLSTVSRPQTAAEHAALEASLTEADRARLAELAADDANAQHVPAAARLFGPPGDQPETLSAARSGDLWQPAAPDRRPAL